jgi:hypothetical protein
MAMSVYPSRRNNPTCRVNFCLTGGQALAECRDLPIDNADVCFENIACGSHAGIAYYDIESWRAHAAHHSAPVEDISAPVAGFGRDIRA